MVRSHAELAFFFFNDTATTEIYTLSLHDALPICQWDSTIPISEAPSTCGSRSLEDFAKRACWTTSRSEEHTSELQSLRHLVCRLLLEKKKKNKQLLQTDVSLVWYEVTTR